MKIRPSTVAGRFYPKTSSLCEEEIQHFTTHTFPSSATPLGGIVPHAGWFYSGPIAASVFQQLALLRKTPPQTLVLFGAVHVSKVHQPTLSPATHWETPLGLLPQDLELAHALPFPKEEHAHRQEHSLEVQLPLIQHFFPQSAILPIATPPTPNALQTGQIVAHALKTLKRDALLIGSTDLTHYGSPYHFLPKGEGPQALHWVREENDARMIRLILGLRSEQILQEALTHQNACGAGAITATLACLLALNPQAKAQLNWYDTSFDLRPQEASPDCFVGYAGITFFS